jgi:putative ubiquitin-RnfH superfamily antitoxin RatB of RatAB toxin-antitoxin module
MNSINFLSNLLDYGLHVLSLGLTGAVTWVFGQISKLNIKAAVMENELRKIDNNIMEIKNNLEKITISIEKKEDIELIRQLLYELKNNRKKR